MVCVAWQVAIICKLYILHLCQWHHVYGVTFSVSRWMRTRLTHSVTAGLFHHIKRTWNTCLWASLCFLLTLFSSLFLLYTALSVSSSLLLIFLHFCPSPFPSLLFSFLPSFLPPSWGKGRFKLWTKDTRRKTLQKHLKCFSPFSVLRNVIHTQGTVSKEAESSWLKPYNAHGSL